MLILTRRLGESIRIGNDVTIQVTRLERDRVQLGIEAPPDVLVWRKELRETDAPLLCDEQG